MEIKEVSDEVVALKIRMAVAETKIEGAGRLVNLLLGLIALMLTALGLLGFRVVFK